MSSSGGGGCCIGDFCCIGDCSFHPIGDIFGCCVFDLFGSSGSSGGGSCGYHPGPSESELHAKKIADELAQMKENLRKSSERQEQQIIEDITSSMTALLNELEGINNEDFGGRKLNINLAGIRQKNEELKNSVRGHIGNILDDRLVLTDKELSVILKERDDKKRGKNFDDFCKRVQRQAILSLRDKIEKTVKAQSEMINSSIRHRLSEVDSNMRDTQAKYNEILRSKEQGDAKREENAIKHIYEYELFNLLFDQLK